LPTHGQTSGGCYEQAGRSVRYYYCRGGWQRGVVADAGSGAQSQCHCLLHDSAGERSVALRAAAVGDLPAGQGNNFHRHPGDQWSAVQEGEVTLTIQGQAPRTLKAGESAYIPRGTVHRNQNLTDKPARTTELNIMDKDKPMIEPVPVTQ
jgi:mannose-6-phosphate isomerase-like protein (cupin superfamily)